MGSFPFSDGSVGLCDHLYSEFGRAVAPCVDSLCSRLGLKRQGKQAGMFCGTGTWLGQFFFLLSFPPFPASSPLRDSI